MKAMLLAAGRGERMRPLTDTTPKPLLMAGGKPLIVRHLEALARAGIVDIVINHAWLGDRIEAALGDGTRFGLSIRYSAEGTALETAGGIAKALPWLGGPQDGDAPFVVVSADVHCDFDFAQAPRIARSMAEHGFSCWCLMVTNPAHHGGGDFGLRAGRLVRDAATRLTYAGIGLYRPSLFAGIVPGTRVALRPLLEREIDADRAGGEHHDGRWVDVGTPQRLAELDRLLAA